VTILRKFFLIIGLMAILCVGIWAAEHEHEHEKYERKPAASCVVPADVMADVACAIERMEPFCRRLLDPGTYTDDFTGIELARQINALLTERVILEEGDEKLTRLQQRPPFKNAPTQMQSLKFFHHTYVLSEKVIADHPEIDPNYSRTLISQFLVLGQLGKFDYHVEERPDGKTPWRKPEPGNPLEAQCEEHGFPLLPQTLVCAQEVAKFLHSNPTQAYSRFRFPLLLEDLNRAFMPSTFSLNCAWDDPDLDKTQLLEDLGYEPAWDFFRFNILYTLLKTTGNDLKNAVTASAGLNAVQDPKLLQKMLFAKAILDYSDRAEAIQAMFM